MAEQLAAWHSGCTFHPHSRRAQILERFRRGMLTVHQSIRQHRNTVIQITYLSSKNKNYWVKCQKNEQMKSWQSKLEIERTNRCCSQTESVTASTSHRGPPTPQTTVAVGDVGGRLASGFGNFKGHWDSLTLRATVVTRNWSCRGRLFAVFQAANDHLWDNYRRTALFVQQWAPCWLLSVVCARR